LETTKAFIEKSVRKDLSVLKALQNRYTRFEFRPSEGGLCARADSMKIFFGLD
jgi:hypothetical protein